MSFCGCKLFQSYFGLPYLVFFAFLTLFIVGASTNTLEETMTQQPHKRQFRELSDETKARISQSMKSLPQRPISWREHLSQALKDYWSTVPHRPTGDKGTMDDEETL